MVVEVAAIVNINSQSKVVVVIEVALESKEQYVASERARAVREVEEPS